MTSFGIILRPNQPIGSHFVEQAQGYLINAIFNILLCLNRAQSKGGSIHFPLIPCWGMLAQKSRLNMKLKSFPAFGTRLWNCVQPDWRKLTKRAFKRKIHKLLLTVLEIEGYYVDAHSVILNLNTSNYYTL